MEKKIKILVPVDFSKYSLETVRFALELQHILTTEYCLFHVVTLDDFTSFPGMTSEQSSQSDKRVQDARAEMDKEVSMFRAENPGVSIAGKVVVGFPFKEICREAEESNVQMIVIGTHGRTGLAHLLIGSTAERVVQHASCPVLSIKPRVL